MPELSADERAAAILDRLPIVFQENHGDVFLAWVSQAIRDAETAQRERADLLELRYEDSRKLNQRLESNFLAERYRTVELEKELAAIRRAGEA